MLLYGCQSDRMIDAFVVVDYGDYQTFNETRNCENNVDWFDKNTLDDLQCTQAFAAQEMRHYLYKIFNNKNRIRVIKPEGVAPQGNKITIATLKQIEANNQIIPKKHIAGIELEAQGFLIKTIKEGEYKNLLIVGADRVGALYGVYDVLETLGVRWFGPGGQNEEVPYLNKFNIPEINKVDKPAFITRGFWAKDDRGHADFFNWMARNRINLWSYGQPERGALKKRGINFLTGGHQIQQRFLHPDSEYPYNHEKFESHVHEVGDPYPHSPQFAGDKNNDGILSYSEAHPDWYGLIDGKRDFVTKYKYGTNLCTSNRHAVNELADNFIDDLIEGKWSQADMINFWLSDVGKWCQCSQCRALGSPTDRMLQLVHQVREKINKAMEEARLKQYFYLIAPLPLLC